MPPIVVIDDFGFYGTTLDTLRDRLSELTLTYVGRQLDLAPETPQGQLATPMVLFTHDLVQALGATVNALNADTVFGAFADAMYSEWGVRRQQATHSTATVTFTGAEDTQIVAGTRVQSTAGAIFATDGAALMPAAGTVGAAVTAAAAGPVSVATGSLTVIIDSVPGLSSVTNAATGTLGLERETTLEFLERARRAVALNSLGTVEAITAHVAAVAGVTYVTLADNDTDVAFTAAGNRGLTTPRKSFEVIVQGGPDADVAQAILVSKAPGITAHGATTVDIARPLGNTVTIGFTRPTEVPMSWTMTYTPEAGFPLDGAAQLQAAAVAYINALGIGRWIRRNDFLKAILAVPGWDATTINPPVTTSGSADVLSAAALNRFDVLSLTVSAVTLTAA